MRRPAPHRQIQPHLELDCLKVLWDLGEGTVHDVRRVLAERHLAYTTVMTVLDRLEKRGFTTRRKQGRGYVYTPKTSRETLRDIALAELIDTYFAGSRDNLI